MTTIKTFIKRHPVPTYFALTFAISWGGILLVIGGPGGIPGTSEQTEMLFPIALVVMLAGPSVAGILLTGLAYGRAGLREFLSRLLRWRVGARWYAVALLTTPLLVTATLFALSLTSPVFLPGIVITDDKATLLLSGIVVLTVTSPYIFDSGAPGFVRIVRCLLKGEISIPYFALAVSINRFTQFGAVRQALASGTVAGIDWFLPYGDRSIMFGLEMLGWGWFLGLAMPFAAPLFSNGTVHFGLRWLLILYGILGWVSAVAYLLASPLAAIGFVAWGLILYLITALLAIHFRKSEKF